MKCYGCPAEVRSAPFCCWECLMREGHSKECARRQLVSTLSGGFVEVSLSDDHVRLALSHARRAEIGGQSNVRTADRMAALMVDQRVGQIGTLGYFLYALGPEGAESYDEHRKEQNLTPLKGDGGHDMPGEQIDVKTSLWRKTSRSLWLHRLCVRPAERHAHWVYVLAMTPKSLRKVWLLGWARDEDLPEPDSRGVFEGAHTLVANALRRLPVSA